MAPSLPIPNSPSGLCSPVSDDVFEGPEKKLWVTFYPIDCNQSGELRNLRSLPRAQIETVTDAAKCTILSYVSNSRVDAYLLSESSLFVTDYSMTIKTCGTTTLLRALGVILQLGSSLGLSPERVSFTRVAYLFPNQQLFPHTSFDSEVAYLDEVLRSYGRVFRNASDISSNWFCYLASFPPKGRGSESLSKVPTTYTLEIAMFDLDPREMRQFMFHSDLSRVGGDDLENGTTARAGIFPLISGADAVDAFNFAPCGYSLNAIAPCGGYYTIHVTPEDGASYLSFEATVESGDPASLVVSVINLFRPSRFTVSVISIIPISDAEFVPNKPSGLINSAKLDKLLCGSFAPTSFSNVQNLMMPTCDITTLVTTYRSTDELFLTNGPNLMPVKPVIGWRRDLASAENLVAEALDRVSKSYGATGLPIGLDLNGYELSSILPPMEPDQVHPPTVVIDLAQVSRNYVELFKTIEHSCVELRYTTRCCADLALLELLAGFEDIVFEIADAEELNLLDRLEVPKERLVLRVAVPVTSTLRLLDHVSGVILHDIPDPDMAAAIQQAKVFVEFVSTAGESGDDENYKISVIQDMTKTTVRAVGWEGSSKGFRLSKAGGKYLHIDDNDSSSVGAVMSDAVAAAEGRLVVAEVSLSLMDRAMSVVLSVVGQCVRLNAHCKDSDKSNERSCRQFCYLNDGMYGIFGGSWLKEGPSVSHRLVPRLVGTGRAAKKVKTAAFHTTVWGPTCDASDRIWDGRMAEVDVGERLVFDNVGAFCLSSVTRFNGFSDHFKYFYVTSEPSWRQV